MTPSGQGPQEVPPGQPLASGTKIDIVRDGPVASFSAVCSRFARERRPSLHLLAATLMVSPNSSGRGDFARGLYVENDLPFRR